MTLALDGAPASRGRGLRHLGAGATASAAVLAVLLVTLAAWHLPPLLGLAERSPRWVWTWPAAWTLPVTDWISYAIGGFLEWSRPAGRAIAAVMEVPMDAMDYLLTDLPWPVVCGAIAALAWWIGGWRMALLAAGVLGFILITGYWLESMRTLKLVAVSVPLALLLGVSIGILAHEIRWIRATLETVLDVMQTVPTFAYLTPLLVFFGFGPVVGLIASAIYAAPPMARNVLLGLERVDPEIKEAGVMAGATRMQQLLHVKLPAAGQQIMVGINQCVMAALSMVIIAAVIGADEDIGWEVVRSVQKADIGTALPAGFVIVALAVLIDRMSAGLAEPGGRGDWRVAFGILGAGILAGLQLFWTLPDAGTFGIIGPVSSAIDAWVAETTREHGAALDATKNAAMFYALLPVKIGIDDLAGFVYGFEWTPAATAAYFGAAAALALLAAWRGRIGLAALLFFGPALIFAGLTQAPWPVVLAAVVAIGWRAGGWGIAAFAGLSFAAILAAGLWERAMFSIYLCGVAVIACAIVGGALGLLAAVSPLAWRWVLRPICDTLQTIPLFVFLIPMLMFFQIGEFSAFLAICAYAIVPMIRYTRHGLTTTPGDLLEAAIANGATGRQIMLDVRIPYAMPTILLGLNQTILYAFAMLVIAALIGTTGLGQSIYIALGQADVGLGIAAGAAMALLALVADRLIQAFAREQRKALGL